MQKNNLKLVKSDKKCSEKKNKVIVRTVKERRHHNESNQTATGLDEFDDDGFRYPEEDELEPRFSDDEDTGNDTTHDDGDYDATAAYDDTDFEDTEDDEDFEGYTDDHLDNDGGQNGSENVKNEKKNPFAPKYSFWEIPAIAQRYMFTISAVCAAIVLFSLIFALMERSLTPLIGVGVGVLAWGYFFFQKCYPFMYDTALCFDADIVEQRYRNTEKIQGKLAQKAIKGFGKYLFVKCGEDYYKITIPNFKEELGAGGRVRIYFHENDRYEKTPNYYLILDPIFVEILESVLH